ncbi:MAG: alpha/beta hydrolase, partial [Actinomycetota bacterium]|nr:alpha/beta hydrolase [Actinomycetota bacterium]
MAVLGAWVTTRRITAPGPRERKFVTPWELGVPHEEVSFRTEDSLLLGGWWLPSPEAKRTIIALHGHRGARHHCVGIAASLEEGSKHTPLVEGEEAAWGSVMNLWLAGHLRT